mmetsp:Transcript_35911/g.65927  ORF Transcript_35911/g.65927 Transcript_35911/m.65927 type:complete len:749 (+) Transcript_35911:75-2321(+)
MAFDKKLRPRIRDIRLRYRENNAVCSTDMVVDELKSQYPEYARAKSHALKALVRTEMDNNPLPDAAGGEQDGGNEEASASKRRKKGAVGNENVAADSAPSSAQRGMNDSLLQMYKQSGTQSGAEQNGAAGADGNKKGAHTLAERRARLAKEKAAMAAARKELGLPPPQTNPFAPEERPDERLEDLGGIETVISDLRLLVIYPLTHPEVFTHLGVQPPIGVLLHGPPGCGKSKLAHALAGSCGVPFFKVAATEIVSGMSGESEAKIRQLFQAAISSAPSLLFLDEVDAITPKRDTAGREMERRIVAQLLTCMDELQNKFVIVMGATNRPDALDPALRRAGRFDREIAMGIPDEAARVRILDKMCRGMRLAEDLDVPLLANLTPGYVGADLNALTKEAALSAVNRAFSDLDLPTLCGEDGQREPFNEEKLKKLAVDMVDFKAALTKVQPSARREGFATIPDVTFEDVGALDDLQQELDAAVCEPIRKAQLFQSWGLTVPVGVLLFGPPGCGKTLLAKAAANASGANFIAIKGPELLNKYVGESERAVRLVFQRAVSSAPCVIFFDELDALVPRRSAEGSSSAERVVNQMLTEMDGVQQRSQVFVVAATNRPDIIDPAMLRPGRLDRLLFVPLPSESGRADILRTHSRKLPLADDVDLHDFARDAEGFSGADLAALVREAAYLAIRQGSSEGSTPNQISKAQFALARQRIGPSVGKQEQLEYEELAAKLCGGRHLRRDVALASSGPTAAAA